MEELFKQIDKKIKVYQNHRDFELEERASFMRTYLDHLHVGQFHFFIDKSLADFFQLVLYTYVKEESIVELQKLSWDLEDFFTQHFSKSGNKEALNHYYDLIDSLFSDSLLLMYENYRVYSLNKEDSYHNPIFDEVFEVEKALFPYSGKRLLEVTEEFYAYLKKIPNIRIMKILTFFFCFQRYVLKSTQKYSSASVLAVGEQYFHSSEVMEFSNDLEVECISCELQLKKLQSQTLKHVYSLEQLKIQLRDCYEKNKLVPNQIFRSLLLEDDLKFEVYRACLQHNEMIYKNMISKHEDSYSYREQFLASVFSKYGFDLDCVTNIDKKRLTLKFDFNRLNEILKLLYHNGEYLLLAGDEYFVNVLLSVDVSFLKKSLKQFEAANFPYYFIKNNFITLLHPTILELVLRNMDLLVKYKVNLSLLFQNQPEVLFFETDILRNRFASFKTLGISFTSTISNFYSLYADDFCNIFYTFYCILGDAALNNFEFIHDDYEILLKRIRIAKILGMELFTDKGKLKKSIITGNKFEVPDEELDIYTGPCLARYISLT